MKLSEIFKAASEELNNLDCMFAVGGGLAADLYRKETRTTKDADFLFLADGMEIDKGRELLEKLNLGVGEVKLHQLTRSPSMNKKSKEVYMLVGRAGEEGMPGVDLLLPPFPWFANAIRRAQSNLMDFGFGPVPTLTAEDIILAKLFANRYKDLDDVQSIFEAKKPLEIGYLAAEMDRLGFSFPLDLARIAPRELRRFAKRKVQNKISLR
jgi:hypothetical protein